MNTIVEDVLEDFNWEKALAILRKYVDASKADRIASMGRSSFTEEKVIRELKSIEIDDPLQVAAPAPTKRPEPSQSVQKDESHTDQSLIEKRNEHVRTRDVLRGQLQAHCEPLFEDSKYDPTRYRIAVKILEETEALEQTWADIRYFEAYGSTPTKEDVDSVEAVFEGASIIQVLKIKKNYTSYLSKAKKGDRKPEKIPFYTAVVAEADKRLSNAGY